MRLSYELNEPDRVTVGTMGEVGERIFLLQVREGPQLVTMKVEKSQIATLCRVLDRILRGLERPEGLPTGATLELEQFEGTDLVVRTLRVGYDGSTDRILLVCDEAEREEGDDEDEDDEELEGSVVHLAMTREQAAALAIRGTELVAAGRPLCPRCGYPLDPRGHVCPRMNGNAPPRT